MGQRGEGPDMAKRTKLTCESIVKTVVIRAVGRKVIRCGKPAACFVKSDDGKSRKVLCKKHGREFKRSGFTIHQLE